MASRKVCNVCNKSFGKSAYYDHLPCRKCMNDSLSQELSKYIFCDHCSQRVSKKTFREHQNLKLNRTSSNGHLRGKDIEVDVRMSDYEVFDVEQLNLQQSYPNDCAQEEKQHFSDEELAFFSDDNEAVSDQSDGVSTLDAPFSYRE